MDAGDVPAGQLRRDPTRTSVQRRPPRGVQLPSRVRRMLRARHRLPRAMGAQACIHAFTALSRHRGAAPGAARVAAPATARSTAATKKVFMVAWGTRGQGGEGSDFNDAQESIAPGGTAMGRRGGRAIPRRVGADGVGGCAARPARPPGGDKTGRCPLAARYPVPFASTPPKTRGAANDDAPVVTHAPAVCWVGNGVCKSDASGAALIQVQAATEAHPNGRVTRCDALTAVSSPRPPHPQQTLLRHRSNTEVPRIPGIQAVRVRTAPVIDQRADLRGAPPPRTAGCSDILRVGSTLDCIGVPVHPLNASSPSGAAGIGGSARHGAGVQESPAVSAQEGREWQHAPACGIHESSCLKRSVVAPHLWRIARSGLRSFEPSHSSGAGGGGSCRVPGHAAASVRAGPPQAAPQARPAHSTPPSPLSLPEDTL